MEWSNFSETGAPFIKQSDLLPEMDNAIIGVPIRILINRIVTICILVVIGR